MCIYDMSRSSIPHSCESPWAVHNNDFDIYIGNVQSEDLEFSEGEDVKRTVTIITCSETLVDSFLNSCHRDISEAADAGSVCNTPGLRLCKRYTFLF